MNTRTEERQFLHAYYEPLLTSAKLVLNHQWGDPKGETPVVFFCSGGSDLKNLNGNFFELAYLLEAHVLVLDSRVADNYIAEDAEDVVDAIAMEFLTNFEPLMTNERWQRIEMMPSVVLPKEDFGGMVYRHEAYGFKVFPKA